MVETVLKTIKSELVWRTIFQTRAETATQKERPDAWPSGVFAVI
jgi:hypothetical protein